MVHKPDEKTKKMVESMSAYGITQTQIARVVGCDEKTLRKYYAEELENAEAKANTQVANVLYKKAMEGDLTAVIFWLKTRARWRDFSRVEITGADKQPQQVNITFGVRKPDDDQP